MIAGDFNQGFRMIENEEIVFGQTMGLSCRPPHDVAGPRSLEGPETHVRIAQRSPRDANTLGIIPADCVHDHEGAHAGGRV